MRDLCTCPVCGEMDMSCERVDGFDNDTVLLVRCTNLSCPSNITEVGSKGPLKTKVYFHRSKESNWDLQSELGLPDSAMEKFRWMGMEIGFDVEIDPKTGETYATHFQGQELSSKVQLT